MSSYSFQGVKRVWTPRDEEENRAIFAAQAQDTGIKMPLEFTPVYLDNAQYATEKWSQKQLIRLLRLYGSHRCVWDVRDPDRKNRQLRRAAMIDITAALGDKITVEQVLQKINVLRGTYRYEKRRIKERMRKGLGASTKLKWFALADAFLRNVPRVEKSRKINQHVDSDSDLEENVVFAIDPDILMPLDRDGIDAQNHSTDDAKEINVPNSLEKDHAHNLYSSTPSPQPMLPEIITADYQDSELLRLENTSARIDHLSSSKRPWTSLESILFVELLSKQPILWQNYSHDSADYTSTKEYNDALQHIANSMALPTQRIKQRLRKFKQAYAEEKLKSTLDPGYKSHFIWFTLADNFMPTHNLEAPNFVDPNMLPPPTPNCKEEMNGIKKELTDCETDYEAATPINPIGSVATETMQEAAENESLETIFNREQETEEIEADNSRREEEYNTEANLDATDAEVDRLQEISSSTNPTKLIWNGLEDDLLEGKWSLKHSVKFLRLYGSHRCLWDLNDRNYRSRALRNAAIEDIAAAMGHGLDADYVAKKIKIFRITYMQHRKRMLESYKDGKSETEVQLRWFPLADSFLRPHIGLRSIKEHEEEMPQFDLQYVYANLNLIDPALLNDFVGKGTQNSIEIGDSEMIGKSGERKINEQGHDCDNGCDR